MSHAWADAPVVCAANFSVLYYIVMFSYCDAAYLVGWCCMKDLMSHYKNVKP